MALIRSNARALVLGSMLLALASRARADDAKPAATTPSASVAPTAAAPTPAATLEPPRPIGLLGIAYPKSAPPRTTPVTVTARLTIGPDGTVTAVQIDQSGGEPFDAAVTAGVKSFRFQPATLGGQPVAVAVPFSQTFMPPPPPTTQKGPPPDALLEGLVIERGTRKPLANATVAVKDALGEHVATTDARGHFLLPLSSGEKTLDIVAANHRRFTRRETLRHDEHFKVKYLVDRDSYNPYESVVVGQRDREAISRTTLSGREIHQLPGTFGDPFKVVDVLPGVTNVMSLLPLPVVRGSSPGDTGIFLDGVRLPLLYHLFGGPSVIHPELINRVDFYPGGFPVTYGGYTGGIIDGRTKRPRAGDDKLDIDLNLLQSGIFAQHEIPGTSMMVTVAGRYGYPGMLLSLLTNQIDLSYWDYQARVDGGHPGSVWSLFVYGAKDELDVKTPAIGSKPATSTPLERFLFHRLDLSWKVGNEDRYALYRLVAGYDDSTAAGSADSPSWMLDPQATFVLPLSRSLRLDAGAEAMTQLNASTTPAATSTSQAAQAAQALLPSSGTLANGGAYVEAPWKPSPNLLITPGVRADGYTDQETTQSDPTNAATKVTKRVWQWSVDPRISARWRPPGWQKVWLKGVIGRYHQPPRLFIPIPGAEEAPLSEGLLASTQYSVGAEAALAPGIDLDVQTYYNDMDPVLFDLTVNPSLAEAQTSAPTTLPGQLPPPGAADASRGAQDVSSLFQKMAGHSYGLEVMLRKRDTSKLFGWLAYTLSRSERHYPSGWAPYDFDRTHIFNAVAGVKLPRNWEFGARLLLQSGTPVTTIHGYNDGRTPWEFRADLRIDKRAVWNTWLLDFYVDIVNTTLAEETGGLIGSNSIRYVLPTIGFRAVL